MPWSESPKMTTKLRPWPRGLKIVAPEGEVVGNAPQVPLARAVKKAEDANGLIFRAYEWAGKDTTAEFHVPPGATGATVTNLMETPEGSPLQVAGDTVRVPIHHYEILTIRVDYPASAK